MLESDFRVPVIPRSETKNSPHRTSISEGENDVDEVAPTLFIIETILKPSLLLL